MMGQTPPGWRLLDTSTNDHGVTHYTVSCLDAMPENGDYEELLRVLKREFGAREAGELCGPYSVHKYLEINGLLWGVILDWPDWLYLFVKDELERSAADLFVAKLLDALNAQSNS